MSTDPDANIPPDLADRVESALRALWRGDSGELEALLDAEDGASLPLSELYKDALNRQTVPIVGLSRHSEVRGYKIIREIGRGGMGVVFEAEQQDPRRRVALKVLAGLYSDEEHVRMFRQEIQTLARLKHPAIATIHEAGRTEDGYHFFTMELINGHSLTEYARRNNLALEDRLELFLNICQAIQYAHISGVIHRDLKPSNIIVDAEGNPKILDFGLARVIDVEITITASMTRTDKIMGTLAYMSPEQTGGHLEAVDSRTDVYSLGIILYELLTQRLPFVFGRTMPHEAVRIICEEQPTRPGTINRHLSGDLETIILKALEKSPTRRYQTPSQLADDIRRYLSNEPIVARRPNSLYILRKKLGKHRLATGLCLAGVVLALLGSLTSSWMKRKESAQAQQRALWIQHDLEAGRIRAALGRAQAEYATHPDLPEPRLVYDQARFRTARDAGDERTVDAIVGDLRDELARDQSQWIIRALLSEFYRACGDPRAAHLRKQVIAEAPETAEAYYLRSLTTLNVEEALNLARHAVGLDPDHLRAWQRLAYLYLLTEDFDSALDAGRRLLEVGDNRAEWSLFIGRILTRQGRYTEAVGHFSRTIALDPTNPVPYVQRAVTHLCLKAYQPAIDDHTRASELFGPAQTNQCYQRATPYWISGQLSRAISDYRSVLSRRGRVTYADVRLYLVLHEHGRDPRERNQTTPAEDAFEQARVTLRIARKGVDPGSWLETIFKCLTGEISPDELVAAADPNRPEEVCEAYYYAGESRLVDNRPTEARRWFEKCVATNLIFDPNSDLLGPMNEYHLALWRLDLPRQSPP